MNTVVGFEYVAIETGRVRGSSRSSPRTFYAHHAAAVSAAVQAHESLTLENAAASLARSLLANPSPLSRALVGVTAP